LADDRRGLLDRQPGVQVARRHLGAENERAGSEKPPRLPESPLAVECLSCRKPGTLRSFLECGVTRRRCER
jgi:hypothetical protein